MNIRKNTGITLVALVVTIIVLIILAGISINLVLGENGIFTKAQKAKKQTEIATEEEQRQLTIAKAAMSFENREYIDKNGDKAIIPAGFAVSQVEGENAVENGLVIIDSNGNEFVWIPVARETFETNFKRVEGYIDGDLEDKLTKTDEANILGQNSILKENTIIQEEAKAMYTSVKLNAGFYIGRYEAGKENNGNVVSKKNTNVYNNIVWGQNMINITGGAVEKAQSMYLSSSSVASTLCYGVQWDAVLNFIDSNYITSKCEPDSYVRNANGKGWDRNNYIEGNKEHLTGIDVDKNKSNCQKNIYDIAGNVSELTMEMILTEEGIQKPYRVRRGTGFDWDCNASNRSTGGSYPNEEREFIGFRVALYLK